MGEGIGNGCSFFCCWATGQLEKDRHVDWTYECSVACAELTAGCGAATMVRRALDRQTRQLLLIELPPMIVVPGIPSSHLSTISPAVSLAFLPPLACRLDSLLWTKLPPMLAVPGTPSSSVSVTLNNPHAPSPHRPLLLPQLLSSGSVCLL